MIVDRFIERRRGYRLIIPAPGQDALFVYLIFLVPSVASPGQSATLGRCNLIVDYLYIVINYPYFLKGWGAIKEII